MPILNNDVAREMALDEIVNALPGPHRARSEYIQLLEDQALLNALCACGVDNWDGWEDAIALRDERS